MRRRRFSKGRLRKWLDGRMTFGRLLRLARRDREDLELEAHRRVGSEQFPSASRLFELLSLLWPDADPMARLGTGVCAQRMGDLAAAERAYGEVIAADPTNAYALANRAEVFLLTQRPEAARADLASALQALGDKKVDAGLRGRIDKLRELAEV